MARIFYYSATGLIYGIHTGPHEDNPKIKIPEGVEWLDVPEPPDQIAWPSPDGGLTPGDEHLSRINAGVIELRLLSNQELETIETSTLKLPTNVQIENLINTIFSDHTAQQRTVLIRLAKLVRGLYES